MTWEGGRSHECEISSSSRLEDTFAFVFQSFWFTALYGFRYRKWSEAKTLIPTQAMKNANRFLFEHQHLTRRHFLRLGVTGAAAFGFCPLAGRAEALAPELAKATETLEPYFTPQEKFRDVSRGKPLPH